MTLTKEMHVEVGHALAAVRAVVDHKSEPFVEAQLVSDFPGREQQVTEHGLVLGGGFTDARNHFFGNDQHVHRRLRLNIVNDNAEIVLEFDFSGDLAVDDFFEESFQFYRREQGERSGYRLASGSIIR